MLYTSAPLSSSCRKGTSREENTAFITQQSINFLSKQSKSEVRPHGPVGCKILRCLTKQYWNARSSILLLWAAWYSTQGHAY